MEPKEEVWKKLPNVTRPVKPGVPAAGEHDTGRSRIDFINNIRQDLPPVEKLPEPIQAFIEDLNDPDYTAQEKMMLVHAFLAGNTDYESRAGTDFSINRKDLESMETWTKGNCGNQAQLASSLLQYAGLDPSDMTYVQVKGIKYDDKNHDINHAVLTVRDNESGKLMLFDINRDEPISMEANDDGLVSESGNKVEIPKENMYFIFPIDEKQSAIYNATLLEASTNTNDNNLTNDGQSIAPVQP